MTDEHDRSASHDGVDYIAVEESEPFQRLKKSQRSFVFPLAVVFLVFVLATMIIVFRASRNNKTAADYYAAGRSFTGPQNGTAIAGDYLSAASFLGICGAIAINGYDGFLY